MNVPTSPEDFRENLAKALHDKMQAIAYASGYGQAKADMMSHITDAIAQTHAALQRLPASVITHPGQVPPGTAVRIGLEIRLSELQRLRTVCEAMQTKEGA